MLHIRWYLSELSLLFLRDCQFMSFKKKNIFSFTNKFTSQVFDCKGRSHTYISYHLVCFECDLYSVFFVNLTQLLCQDTILASERM